MLILNTTCMLRYRVEPQFNLLDTRLSGGVMGYFRVRGGPQSPQSRASLPAVHGLQADNMAGKVTRMGEKSFEKSFTSTESAPLLSVVSPKIRPRWLVSAPALFASTCGPD